MMGKHNEDHGVKDIYDHLSDRWWGRAGVRKGQDQDQDDILRTECQIYLSVASLLLKKWVCVITISSSCCSLNAAGVDDFGNRERKL